ncbi:hypothetical protein [Endozoicomonas sp. GU-1]|uniref:hypothetical protein n=1 Tax=Endozoicomonas sp. GU-1 TaxID=3009078 RepID=UPI0022B49A87|nr:hypothetical protein [Endozoicomonas sp. GU-1]WBA82772.1 hypothetical protein O2T12_06490 [Endozoicomonas sp. GU-1]WBA85701.1 hypothetical protein O3276_21135 [Endozoicomonas sp. GU-1]
MKLRIDQLGAQLKKQLVPVYIVSGDEPLQVARCCDQIRQYARNAGFSERHVYHIENGFDWGGLSQHGQQPVAVCPEADS